MCVCPGCLVGYGCFVFGIWSGLSSNGWRGCGVLRRGSAVLRDWPDESGLESPVLSIDLFLPHRHPTVSDLRSDFFFLSRFEKRNSIERNLIPSAPALDTCTCFDQSCEKELCFCPTKKRRQNEGK